MQRKEANPAGNVDGILLGVVAALGAISYGMSWMAMIP
jgi:hypothetical protein